VRDALASRRRMAVVFQEPLLLDTSVEANAASGLAVRGVPAGERRRRVAHWLERFGVAHLAKRSARTLSGGEAQRVSLARAFAVQPEVLFLDEPFAALDAPTRQALTDELAALLSEGGMATVFVTHDRAEALRLGDRVAVLIAGRVRQVGTPAEVFGSPADEEIAQFVGAETIVTGTVCSVDAGVAVVDAAGHAIEGGGESLAAGERVLVCLRPEDVVLGPVREGVPTSARNHVAATVTRIVPQGPFLRVELDAGFSLVALITKQSREDLAIEAGSRLLATFKASAVHLIRKRA
jgi:tungstate transport system ATP-binding protein